MPLLYGLGFCAHIYLFGKEGIKLHPTALNIH